MCFRSAWLSVCLSVSQTVCLCLSLCARLCVCMLLPDCQHVVCLSAGFLSSILFFVSSLLSVHVPACLCVSLVPVSMSLSVRQHALSVTRYVCLSLLCLSYSVRLTGSLSLSLSLSASLCLSSASPMSITWAVCMSLYLFVCHCVILIFSLKSVFH